MFDNSPVGALKAVSSGIETLTPKADQSQENDPGAEAANMLKGLALGPVNSMIKGVMDDAVDPIAALAKSIKF